MSGLHLRNVEKYFGDNHVLKAVDLSVEDGEFVVIVGPSGCGKSTLLRVIAGLEEIDSGEIEMDGVDIKETPPSRRGIAMVFQSYALYPHMTVFDNLAFSLRMKGLPRAEIAQRVEHVFDKLGLNGLGDRKPTELSGGQRQRVALGRALVREPKLFLFDEPLSNLDAALRMSTRVEIADLHLTLGTSMIYVTHDQTEAMTLADRIVVMRDGRIEQIGSPLELYNTPVNQFVAGFLGSPTINFIPAKSVGFEGAAVIGVRPQYLRKTSPGRLSGRVEHFERLGSDTHVLVDIAQEQSLVVRLAGQHEFTRGQTIHLDFDDVDVMLFDEAGGRIPWHEERVAS